MADIHTEQQLLSQPDYTAMIMTAVEVLSTTAETGVNKEAITRFIETNNPDLPPAHSALVSNALDKMMQSGQLFLTSNSYSKPDPNTNTPIKRGRGRPPKPKSANSTNTTSLVPGPVRPRGRPPKPKSASGPTQTLVPGPPRPRGRPPKPNRKVISTTTPSSSGRPRGRPRKNNAEDTTSAAATTTVSAAPFSLDDGVKRGRGRPRKNA